MNTSEATEAMQSRISPWVWSTLAGLLIGYLLRPSYPLVGQLPFWIVVTRGATLSGWDALLVPAAAESFNTMAGGAAVGLVLGALASSLRASGVTKQGHADRIDGQ